MTSAANAAATHELCNHAGMSDSAMMDHAGHMDMTASDEHDNEKDQDQHHDGCCDGVCLCSTMVSSVLSPATPDLGEPYSRSRLTLPSADEASDLIRNFDLPPPRLG